MLGVIAAAARSPRLLPLTKDTPVSLIEVGGRPVLDYQLETLRLAGVDDTLVITGFCANQVEEFCKGRATCVYNPFYESGNLAMNLWMVRQEITQGLILLYNDIMFQDELVKEVLAREDGILLVIDPTGLDREAEKVALREGVVTAIGKDVAEPSGEFIGMARFSRNTVPVLVQELEEVARTDLDTTFPGLIQRIVQHGHTVGVHTSDRPWTDIDFPSDLEEARRLFG